jgi:hypothetical protein
MLCVQKATREMREPTAGYGDGDTLRAPANFQLREAFYWMMAEIKLLAAVARLWANENIYIII